MKLLVNGYTVSETLELKRVERDLSKIDAIIGHIKRNKDRYLLLVILVALITPSNMLLSYTVASTTDIGMTAYNMGKIVAKAICLLGWLADAIKCVLTGTVDGLGKISIKWVSFALIVKFLPAVVDWIFTI